MTSVNTPGTSAPATAPTTPAVDPWRFGWRYVWQRDENGQMVQTQVPLQFEDLLHPQEGDVIVQTDAHTRDCLYLRDALRLAMQGRPGTHVFCDHRIDWGKEGLKEHCPDLVVFENLNRPWPTDLQQGTFPVVDYQAKPLLLIEVTSPTTRSHDLDTKVLHYHRAGVPLYVIVDFIPELPTRQVRLLAYRATPEGFIRLEADEQGRIWLEPVRLWLAPAEDRCICYDEQGNAIPDMVQAVQEMREITARAEELQQVAEDAILARQESERQRLEAEKKAADEVRQRLDAEKKASDFAAQLAALQARLQALESGKPST